MSLRHLDITEILERGVIHLSFVILHVLLWNLQF